MPEPTSRIAHEQSAQALTPVETQMLPMVEQHIPLDTAPIASAEQLGLPEDGTMDAIGQFVLGKGARPDGTTGPGVTVFLVRLTNPGGSQEYGLYGGRTAEDGRTIVNVEQGWSPVQSGLPEIVIGRGDRPAGHDEYGKKCEKRDITAFAEPGGDTAGVSRAHLGIRYDYRHGRLAVRDLNATNGTRQVTYKDLAGQPEQEQATRERVEPTTATRIGSTASRSLITEVPPHLQATPGAPSSAETAATEHSDVQEADGHIGEQLREQIAALTEQITADPALADVEHVRTRIREIEADKKENWRDAQKPVSKREFDNHAQQSRRLQELQGSYQRDLNDLVARGAVAAFDTHPLVQQRAQLQDDLRAISSKV